MDTIICRCEEILLSEIEAAIDEGCRSVGAVKRYTRAGMGPCQGRSCGKTIAAIISKRTGTTPSEPRQDKVRFPLIPLTIDTLADIENEDTDMHAEDTPVQKSTGTVTPPQVSVPRKKSKTGVVIVGGGYHGAAAAYSLCKAGVPTWLIEKNEIGTGASGNNFGCIQLQDSNPGTSFLLNNRGFEKMARMEEELKTDLEFRRMDSLLYAQTKEELEELEKLHREKKEAGLEIKLLEPGEVRQYEPNMDTSSLTGATLFRQAGINPFKYLYGLTGRATSEGLVLRERKEVLEIVTEGNRCRGVLLASGELVEADHVVVAAGAWSPKVLASVGIDLPVHYVIGEAFVSEPLEPCIRTFLSSASFFTTAHGSGEAATSFTTTQTLSGNILLAETSEPGPEDPDRALHLTSGAHCRNIPRLLAQLFPSLSKVSVMRSWTTCSPSTPDFEPFLGFPGGSAPEGLILACGFKSSVVISPVVGEIVKDLVTKGECFCDLSPFQLR